MERLGEDVPTTAGLEASATQLEVGMMMFPDHERFDTSCAGLCPALRWKQQFIGVEHDPTVPASNDGLFWCMYTQTCIGPDGSLAEPGKCSSAGRACHGSGQCG
jgi:hypothetical protein